ncbi:alpha/beta fold hydrolase [Paraburkholderia sp. XV]|uniref:alpha/beta fold hydrolase n=1 Tax=Paraburkholderia sp. XV TaxID=2831520 RepID=UPI001CD2B4F1|nr:alpha/beta hydrolase [Paraburkholderia sp. XV]
MQLETSIVNGRLTSSDGTSIGYESFGDGPGVVLVQGAMGTARNYHQLALAMSDRFTVHVPDRRGRGLSPRPYDAQHSIQKDVDDIRVLLKHTGAQFLFGLSSGAVIVLESLRRGIPVERAAVYEPPFYLGGMATHLVARFNTQVERERLDDALATAMRIVGLGPRILQFVPHRLLRLVAASALRVDDRRSTSYASLRELIPAMRYDFNVVSGMNEHLHDLRAVSTPVLLIGGSRSPDYLKKALVALRATLPYCECIELAGADHSSPWNEDLNGKPKLLASVLVQFFATNQARKTP